MINTSRDKRQQVVLDWTIRAFGHDTLKQRALRMLEEAIELYQACGLESAQAHCLVDYVFGRPIGNIPQELGGLGVCVLALAERACLSADDCEMEEIERVLSKPIEHFQKRNQTKNDLGFKADDLKG